MPLVPVDLSVKIIQNTINDCKAFRLSLLKPKVQTYRPDGLPNQALSVPGYYCWTSVLSHSRINQNPCY